jgi:hypothetical protein
VLNVSVVGSLNTPQQASLISLRSVFVTTFFLSVVFLVRWTHFYRQEHPDERTAEAHSATSLRWKSTRLLCPLTYLGDKTAILAEAQR